MGLEKNRMINGKEDNFKKLDLVRGNIGKRKGERRELGNRGKKGTGK
jgi:hypothetical protein